MNRLDLSSILICPECGAALPSESTWGETGTRCGRCETHVPVVRGIPRFVESDAYTASFSFEWKRHRQTQLDDAISRESEETFRVRTGLRPADVAGRLILDVGCGMGRYLDVVSRWGGRVVGIDLSLAVESASANLGARESVRILQADLFRPPFRPGSFDIVYSMGVLHHTPDCEKAFRQLVPLVRPGGRLCIWVYGGLDSWQHYANRYRRVTTRMPPRLLHALCHVAIPWYYVCRLPVIGGFLFTLLPISVHPNPDWRVLDTFDLYSPRYRSVHTFPEVYRWFISEGFADITLHDNPIAVSGTRPPSGL